MGLFDILFGKKAASVTVSQSVPQASSGQADMFPTRQCTVKSAKVMVESNTVDDLEAGFIAIDFETTGLSPQADRIVEIGAVKFKGREAVDRLSMLINPGFPMPASASSVNHITDKMLAGKPKEREAIATIVRFLGDALEGKTLLVAHNAQFDISFLSELLTRRGVNASIRYADTLSMSRHLVRGMDNYKQSTVARHFKIKNPQEHRALADAEVCGLIMCKLLDLASVEVEQEKRLIANSRPTDEEYAVCAFIQDCIVGAGGNAEEIGFYRNSSGYVDVLCTYRIARFKFAKKGRYVVLERSCFPKEYPYSEPCTMTEGGTEYLRLFFGSPYDLEPLRGYFYDKYRDAKKQIAELSIYGIYPDPSDPGTIARYNAISQSRVAELLALAREQPSIRDDAALQPAMDQGSGRIERSEIEISPIYSRAPLCKVRNARNRTRAFNEGFPLWERGDLERRKGSVEASIGYFDRARMAGYAEPALYESYALAFRKLGAYDDEIAILDEAIERLPSHGKLEARRDKAVQLLVKSREKAAREAARKATDEERHTTAESKPKAEAPKRSKPKAEQFDRRVVLEQEIPGGVASARAIIRLDDDFNVLEVYPSVAEASRSTGTNAKSIREAAKGKQRHAGGFVWRYADETQCQN